MPSSGRRARVAVAATAIWLSVCTAAAAQTARERYEAAIARDDKVRGQLTSTTDKTASPDLLAELRQAITAFELVVRRFPTSGYADNALFQAASLADAAYGKFSRAEDRERAVKFYRWLVQEYPASSFVRKANAKLDVLAAPAVTERVTPAVTERATPAAPERATLTHIQRTVMAGSVRVTLALDREVAYVEQRLAGPARVYFDLRNVQLTPALLDTVLTYPSDVVNKIRTGRHPDHVVRVVLDLEDVAKYSVFTLYNPFRLVIDAERTAERAATVVVPPLPSSRLTVVTALLDSPKPPIAFATPPPGAEALAKAAVEPPPPPPPAPAPAPVAVALGTDVSTVGLPKVEALPKAASPPPPLPAAPMPVTPAANTAGGFSIARQLGLSVSRIVIDPGHGGHDPGVLGKGLNEATLVLDVALRLEKLLVKEAGVDVVLTRRTDVYVPLEERTEIANRQNADMFLSIHANASRSPDARGIETFFLSFASSPEAEAVAARENSASAREMHQLPDLIKAITLNNKLDESRDLATMVQDSLVNNLRKTNKEVRSRGVKKAPFVVLIGAAMPSVLAEISFVSNRQELSLLKTPAYRQRIAESLYQAVTKYRRSLKNQAMTALPDR
jgi:N-acetylmuramoyl-L-alanine amidase